MFHSIVQSVRYFRGTGATGFAVLAAGLGATLGTLADAGADEFPPPLVLHGGNVVTMNEEAPAATVVATRDGRIAYVGDDLAAARKAAGEGAEVIDLGGATVLPGLADAHGHLTGLGLALGRLELRGLESADAIAKLVAAAAETAPDGAWIQGRGWDQNLWEGKAFPSRAVLDAVCPDRPVWLRRIDGHAGWANGKALELAGLTADTADPDGGRIERDADGAPTGVLVDNAMGLVSRVVPDPGEAEIEVALERAMRRCAELGLTSVHDAGVGGGQLRALLKLAEAGELPIRVYVMLSGGDDALLDEWLDERGKLIGAGRGVGGRVTVRSIKLMGDGALGSRGAALLAPYTDDPENDGLVVTEPDRIRAVTLRALRAGWQVATHAIGDRTNRAVLDVYESALQEHLGGEKMVDHRLRIEHVQILSLEDLPRFSKLGVIASMQPTHATSDMGWAEDRVGPERIRGAYAWRSLRESGAWLAFGSDFPVERVDPLLGIHAAVARTDSEGDPEGGWRPEERLTGVEAVHGFTVGPAYAAFEDGQRGRIRAGMHADLSIYDTDVTTCEPAEILAAKATLTIVGGRIVYRR